MKKLTFLCTALACLAAAPAFAGNISCRTGSQLPNIINGNMDVPAGQVCKLYGNEVTGNVTVEGVLNTYSVTFDANVFVTGGTIVISNGWPSTPLKGSLTITGSAGNSQIGCPNVPFGNYIYGGITYSGNSGNLYVCQTNVGGIVNINNNQRVNNDYTGPYSADLDGLNASKLYCTGNTEVLGSGINVVKATGDCASLIQ